MEVIGLYRGYSPHQALGGFRVEGLRKCWGGLGGCRV